MVVLNSPYGIPPVLSFSCLNSTADDLDSLCLSSFPVNSSSMTVNRRRPLTITFSTKPKQGSDFVREREFLERYGLDADEILSDRPSKAKRSRELVKPERKGRLEAAEEPKPRRDTHKLLQVLAGTARRKKLLSPKGMDVRPMMEVVKGAAFGILQVAGGCPAFLQPGRWLDLYSGTGSVGIEAISRGCSEAHFVEMDPWVISDVLRPNLEWTGFLDMSVIHSLRVEVFLERAEQFIGKEGAFDYISITPPYMEVDYSVLMKKVSNSAVVGENTFIVVEYPLRTEMLDSCGCLVKIADRRFGRTHLAVYGPKWAQKKRKLEI